MFAILQKITATHVIKREKDKQRNLKSKHQRKFNIVMELKNLSILKSIKLLKMGVQDVID